MKSLKKDEFEEPTDIVLKPEEVKDQDHAAEPNYSEHELETPLIARKQNTKIRTSELNPISADKIAEIINAVSESEEGEDIILRNTFESLSEKLRQIPDNFSSPSQDDNLELN